jgi:hypothetical protein
MYQLEGLANTYKASEAKVPAACCAAAALVPVHTAQTSLA